MAAAAAEATNAPLLDAFNGLLLAIPVLTALAALAALERLPPGRRVVAASLAGLPYLGASFLAQSAFKETAMALLVLAFAVALTELGREPPPGDRQPHPRRAMLVALILFMVASVFVYSLPGLVWFAIAVPIWLALELGTGRLRIDVAAAARRGPPPPEGDRRRGGGRGRGGGALRRPALRLRRQGRPGPGVRRAGSTRRSSPARPWGSGRRATSRSSGARSRAPTRRWRWGCWRRRSAALAAIRRRDFGLVAVGAAAVLVYAGARLFASIYVEAKALAVIAPLVVVAALGALLAPRLPGVGLSDRPLRARRGRRRGAGGLDLAGASRRAGRLRPARRRAGGPGRPGPGPLGRLPRAWTASPATGFAAR